MSHGKGRAIVKESGIKWSKAQTKHQGAIDTWEINFSDSFMGGKKVLKHEKAIRIKRMFVDLILWKELMSGNFFNLEVSVKDGKFIIFQKN